MKHTRKIMLAGLLTVLSFLPLQQAQTTDTNLYWMKIRAQDKFERSVIADTGVSMNLFADDYVVATGNLAELQAVEKLGWLQESFALTDAMDFPVADSAFHNYDEMKAVLDQAQQSHPDIVQVSSIGKTHENRDILAIRISTDLKNASQKPAVVFMAGHHAREHLSVEMPVLFVKYLLSEYSKGNQRIVNMIQSRDIHIIPAVNPDGLEYDVAGAKYKMWRKNRKVNANGTYGVDLNRNYGFGWGTGGSSKSPSSDTYMGTAPFSEPETQAIKNYVDTHQNISILLSFHTYSELILYPWGAKYEGIENSRDKQVHEMMAQRMAQWNGYAPQQSSELYIASGDTTDWSYGVHGIISFTFELDPKNFWGSPGFYPGAKVIPTVFQKNLEPMLYLLEYADNPYRVIDGK